MQVKGYKMNTNTNKQLVNSLSVLVGSEKMFRQAMNVYRKAKKTPSGVLFLNKALQGNLFVDNRYLAMKASEIRADRRDSILERNRKADALCSQIGWLNSQAKELTGISFLDRFYDVRGMMLHQEDISEAIAEITFFCELVNELVEEKVLEREVLNIFNI